MGIKKQGFRFLLTGLLLLVLMLAGCPIPETVQENRTYSIEQMLGYLRGQGFSTDDYSLENNRLVIEGDILFNIEDLKAEMYLSDQDSARQSVCINQVRRSKIINIRINTRAPSPSTSIISESWMAALKSAVDAWNNVRNCILNFVLVDSTAKSDTFVCMEANANTGIVAMASGPDWNGNPGTGICINPNWAGGVENLSPSQKYLVMLHEMGHIVGLQHAEFDLTGYGYIPGTPLNDPMSVMNSMVLGSGSQGLSAGDKYAVTYLYPATGKFVIVYENPNYTGTRWILQEGVGNSVENLEYYRLDMQISSIQCFNGAKVICYPLPYFGGRGKIEFIAENVPDLSVHNYDNAISSIEIFQEPSGPYIVLYSEKGYSGNFHWGRIITTKGMTYLSDDLYKTTSSIHLFNGARALIYDGTGRYRYLSQSCSDLSRLNFDNQISSIRLSN